MTVHDIISRALRIIRANIINFSVWRVCTGRPTGLIIRRSVSFPFFGNHSYSCNPRNSLLIWNSTFPLGWKLWGTNDRTQMVPAMCYLLDQMRRETALPDQADHSSPRSRLKKEPTLSQTSQRAQQLGPWPWFQTRDKYERSFLILNFSQWVHSEPSSIKA